MASSGARRLARELYYCGCPMPRAELARRCGVDHWSQATLDEAISSGEQAGLLKTLPLGWVAPSPGFAVGTRRGHMHFLSGANRRQGA